MHRSRTLLSLLLLATSGCSAGTTQSSSPPASAPTPPRGQATNDATERDPAGELLAEMLVAHGGADAFARMRTLGFEHDHKVGSAPKVWLSREVVATDSRRAYLEWPIDDAVIAAEADGTVWAVNWTKGPPPAFLARLTYQFLTIPWQVHGPGAAVGAAGTGTLPCIDGELDTVDVSWQSKPRVAPGGRYRLFIDRETRVLRGVEFDITHPAMLPPGQSSMGPMLHVFRDHKTVQGLVLPTSYVSFPPKGDRTACKPMATHEIRDIVIDAPLPEAVDARPANAELDPTPWL